MKVDDAPNDRTEADRRSTSSDSSVVRRYSHHPAIASRSAAIGSQRARGTTRASLPCVPATVGDAAGARPYLVCRCPVVGVYVFSLLVARSVHARSSLDIVIPVVVVVVVSSHPCCPAAATLDFPRLGISGNGRGHGPWLLRRLSHFLLAGEFHRLADRPGEKDARDLWHGQAPDRARVPLSSGRDSQGGNRRYRSPGNLSVETALSRSFALFPALSYALSCIVWSDRRDRFPVYSLLAMLISASEVSYELSPNDTTNQRNSESIVCASRFAASRCIFKCYVMFSWSIAFIMHLLHGHYSAHCNFYTDLRRQDDEIENLGLLFVVNAYNWVDEWTIIGAAIIIELRWHFLSLSLSFSHLSLSSCFRLLWSFRQPDWLQGSIGFVEFRSPIFNPEAVSSPGYFNV